MQISVTEHRETPGHLLAQYDHVIYRFEQFELALEARTYLATPGEAHFLRIFEREAQRFITPEDLDRPIFLAAVQHLISIGKTELAWLNQASDGGYTPIVRSAT